MKTKLKIRDDWTAMDDQGHCAPTYRTISGPEIETAEQAAGVLTGAVAEVRDEAGNILATRIRYTW